MVMAEDTALRANRLKEATKDLKAVPFADASQTRMVGKHLGQVVAEVPAQAEPVGHHPHQLALRAQSLKEEDQLQLKEDHRVDRGAADPGIHFSYQITDEGEVERPLQMAIKVTRWHQIVQRNEDWFVKVAGFRWSKHDRLRVGDG